MTAILGLALRHRSFLVVLAIAIVAGGLWVRGEHAIADRDRAVAVADGICAAAGSAWMPEGAGPRDRGKACRISVADLAAFKAKAIAESARLLAEHERDRANRTAGDVQEALRAASRTAAAARRMEKANEQVPEDDRVDGSWFAALNDLAGLRP